MTDKIKPFHLTFPVPARQETLTFYRDVLGCETGRSSDQWVDFVCSIALTYPAAEAPPSIV